MTVPRPRQLLAIVLAAWPMTAARAEKPAAHSSANAAQQQMVRAQEKLLHQQQQYLQQQQRAMQKLYQEQQRLHQQHLKAQQEQLKAHQRFQEQQTKSLQAQQHQPHAGAPGKPAGSGAGAGAGAGQAATAALASKAPQAHLSGTAGHPGTGAVVHAARHGRAYGHGLYYWPSTANNAAARNLYHLKRTLDGIKMSARPTASHRPALQAALMRVAQQPVLTNTSHVQVLSGHLVDGLSRRGLAAVNTQQLALHLRAIMNSPLLSVPEVEQTLVESRALLGQANVPQAQIDSIAGDLQFIAVNR